MSSLDPQSQRKVDEYLSRLRQSLSALPEPERDDAVAEARGHIEEAVSRVRADESQVLSTVLRSLGEPEVFAASLLDTDRGMTPAPQKSKVSTKLALGIVITGAVLLLVAGGPFVLYMSFQSRAKPPQAAYAETIVARFDVKTTPLSRDGVTVDGEGWRVEAKERRTVRLFEVPTSSIEQCMLTFQARMRTEDVRGRAYLEMWCRVPGKGEFFSKGLQSAETGTTDWTSCETPFYLKRGERPDLVRLNVVFEGTGTVWIKEVKLLKITEVD
ncbi:MAG: hypothetical protein HY318_15745 [Armatimonadetes bacterium]|nr:hypothetical protein [Armatimonadota bacterium]